MLFLHNLLALALEAAPWLVLGLTLGGLMKALIPTALLHKHLRGDGLAAILKAALLGAPLPLCSCGVIPVALGLRKAGASKSATASFLVSTPETGIDSISLTYAMMGGFMAFVRPIAALCSAVVAGLLVSRFDRDTVTTHLSETKTCCSTNSTSHAHQAEIENCCSTPLKDDVKSSTTSSSSLSLWGQKAWQGVHYAFSQLLSDIAFWLFIGLLFAAAIQTWMPPTFLAQWGQGLPAMLVMLLAGIPMYICATASTPVAAGLMLAGVSPGTVLVLLLTGPATNISTLGIISKELGKRSMVLYLIGVSVTAIIAGLLVDTLVKVWQLDIHAALHVDHLGVPVTLSWAALILLLALVLWQKGRSTLLS